MRPYFALRMFTRFGSWLAVFITLSIWGGSWWVAIHSAASWPVMGVGLVIGALAGIFLQILVDLTRILSEMLLPR